MLKKTINSALKAVLPGGVYLKLLVWKRGFEEPEMKLLGDLCDGASISLDIGAANGLYLAHLYKLSKKCYAFEPREKAINKLKAMFAHVGDLIQFENVALSSFSGETEFRVMRNNGGLSTMEPENHIEKFGNIDVHQVKVKTLDEYEFSDRVGFIKIDVEGHEESVLKGAMKLIKKDCPSLLIEVEERHKKNSLRNIIEALRPLDYQGFFLINGCLKRVELFDRGKYHNYGDKHKQYVFNFIFIHNSSISRVQHLLQ
jgi:FkbM family methyltransferase